MIELMLCERCNTASYPERLNGMLIRLEERNEPHVEAPLCDDCVQARRSEVEHPAIVMNTARLAMEE